MAIIAALPYNLTNGATADATQVMADFNQIYNNVNANALAATGGVFTSGTITGGTINNTTIGATVPSTGAFSTLGVGTQPGSLGTHTLQVLSSTFANTVFQSATGAIDSDVYINCGTAGNASQLVFQDAGAYKWTIAKANNNYFNIYDIANSKTIFGAAPGGTLTLGQSQNLTIDNSGNLKVLGGAPYSVRGGFANLAGIWSSNTTITYTADYISMIDSNNNAYIATSFNHILNTGVSGIGGLDTGSLAANTWYFVFAAYATNLSGSALVMSLSSTTPNAAGTSGWTYYARIGAIRLDGSKNIIGFKQYGRNVQYAVGSNLSATVIAASGAAGNSSTGTYAAVALGSYVPATASRVRGALYMNNNNGSVAPNGNYGVYSGTTPPPIFVNSAAALTTPFDFMLESTSIYWNNAGSGGGNPPAIQITGWEDNL